MKKPNFGLSLLISIMMSAPLTALFYLGSSLAGLSNVPFNLFDWITRILPGGMITFGIDSMISVLRFFGIDVATASKAAEQSMAILVFFVIATIFGLLFFWITNRRSQPPRWGDGLLLGLVFGLPMIIISSIFTKSTVSPVIDLLWQIILFLAWGIGHSWAGDHVWYPAPQPVATVADVPAGPEVIKVEKINRRQFLIVLGATSAAITVIGTGLAAVLGNQGSAIGAVGSPAEQPHTDTGQPQPQLPNQNDPVTPAPGTRPEYTPLKDHYKVYINLEPNVINGETWSLPITGMVDHPLTLTLDDIRNNYPVRNQYITINCISGRIPTTLIGTTLWTGASVQDILADAGVQPGAQYLYIQSGDGYYETVDLDLINSDKRIMFTYNWDGNPLPVDHGYPLRIWIPDRFGMKQPKWITSVEVTDQYHPGYWVERGWDKVAQVKTRSVIDTVAVDAVYDGPQGKLVPIGGIAFAGARRISRVELQVDGGDWMEAKLRSPLSDTTWVIWRYDWPFQSGDHTFAVRCYEGDGTPQIATAAPPHPSGATGIHEVRKNI